MALYNDADGQFRNLYADGSFDFTITATSTSTQLRLYVYDDGSYGLWDNVSVKEYLGQEVVPNSGCGSWLLEPQSTNLIPYSESLTQWANILYTLVESNSTISPDGSVNADKLVAGATNGLQLRIAPLSLTSGNTYTFSTYVKNSGGNYVILYMNDSSSQGIKVDLVNETFVIMGSSTNHFIKNFGNGWYQIGFTRTIDANVSGLNAVPSLDGNNVSFLGDGVNGIYIWGAQVEQGSYATSYIKTVGTTQTRVADTATGSGNSTVINSSEGVLYAEISALANDGTERNLSLSDGTNSNRISWWFTATNTLAVVLYREGVVQYFSNLSIGTATDYNKIAFKYKENDFALWVNGVELATDTNGSTYSANTLSTINFNRATGALPFYGKVKSVQVYTTALSDAELTTLTTI